MEVGSCPTSNVLGLCVIDQGPVHMELRVYDASVLSDAATACQQDGGTWTLTP
jgi:hypothetical protein